MIRVATKFNKKEQVLSYRIYKQYPSDIVISKLQEHIAQTGQPESFSGLHLGPIARDEKFLRVKPIDVPKSKRPGGDKIPCAMCQPNKFYRGWLAWFPDLQAIGLIGHCCANNETLAIAEREYKERQERDREEAFLMNVLPSIPDVISAIEEAKPAAIEAQRIYRNFRRKAHSLHKRLRQIKNSTGGRLIVTEVLDVTTIPDGPSGIKSKGSDFSTRDIEFGVIAGQTALLADYAPEKELHNAYTRLLSYNKYHNEEDALEYVADCNSKERHTVFVDIQEAHRTLQKYENRIADFVMFFSPQNVERLHRWGQHPENDIPLEAKYAEQYGKPFITISGVKDYVKMLIDPIMWKYAINYPKMGSWK